MSTNINITINDNETAAFGASQEVTQVNVKSLVTFFKAAEETGLLEEISKDDSIELFISGDNILRIQKMLKENGKGGENVEKALLCICGHHNTYKVEAKK